MLNNEYNYFKEENEFKENKSIDVLSINNKDKEVSSPHSDVYKSSEFGGSNKKTTKKDNKNILKKLLQKVTESTSSFMSGVAATAAVVITSVVVLSNVVLDKPTIELLELVEGYNYVEYNISLSDITEGVDYYVVIDNSFESYSFDIDVGENKNIVYDLTSNSVYNLSVIGINNENQTEVKYFSTRFFTKNKVENYKITWMNGDEILEEEYIENGQIPSYDGLAPTKEETIDYIYEFIGWDQEITEATKDTVYKAVFKEIEKEYNAVINLIDESNVIISWDKDGYNEVLFNLGFDNLLNPNLSYRIILTDELNNTYEYAGTSPSATINVPKDVKSVVITYELISSFNGLEKVYSSKTMEKPLIFNNPTVTFSESLSLTGVDEYEIIYIIESDYQDLEQYNLINFDITYSDSTNEIINIDEFNINEENVLKVKVPSFVSSMTINYEFQFLGNNGLNPRTISGTKTYELTNEYYLNKKLVSNIYSPTAIFEFNYHFINEETTISVKDTANDEIIILDLYSNKITTYPDSSDLLKEYTYYLSDLDGNAVDVIHSVSIDCTEVSGTYNFNYVNPGDALVTYNDDGTMNIYLDTVFETEDSDIYYSVVYTNFETGESEEVYYTTSCASFENIELSNYGIVYYVYKNVNDTVHILQEIAVSGGIELTYYLNMSGNITTDDNVNYNISFEFYDYLYQFDEQSFILTINDVSYNIDSSSLVHDETNGCYIFSYTVDFEPADVTVTFQGSTTAKNYDQIAGKVNIKGNKYTTLKVEFY